MKTKLFISLFLISHLSLLTAQLPQGFNYQAIARGSDGKEISNTTLLVKLSVLSDTTGFYLTGTGNYIWEEQQSVTTNSFGLFTLTIGNPLATKIQGSASSFAAIDWKQQQLFIGTKINYGGWKILGASKLLPVPYSLLSENLAGPVDKLAISGTTPYLDEALFEVRNKDGRTVFAVYNEGVRIYVDDGIAGKALKGGFAIGGFDKAKGTIQNYLLVKPDTIRMWIDDTPGKGLKGGFAIGGFDKTKGTTSEYLGVKPEVNEIINPSQPRILWYPLKEAFMAGRVYVPSPDSVGLNSFASGYESRAIGNWSHALGYNAVARGNNSTSIGYNSLAKNANSYAFGTNAHATGLDSYAFGANARATGEKSFALGSVGKDTTGQETASTIASGYGSFSAGLGSVASGDGAFTFGIINKASGIGSLAMGYATSAMGQGSTSLGVGSVADVTGDCALATGILTKAGNWASAAFGDRTYAKGHTSFATGYATTAEGQLSATFGAATYASGLLSFATGLFTVASGWGSTAFGGFTTASGTGAVAMGDNTIAQAYSSLAIGRYNVSAGNPLTWGFWDPVFMVGNGSSSTQRSNAFTVYNSGIADFGSFINLSTNSSYKQAIYVNNNEALWYDGSHFSWGYGANYNYFGRPVTIGGGDATPSFTLNVNGTINSTAGYYNVSDARWKKDMVPLMNTLPLLIQINGYRFNWRNDEFTGMNFESGTQIGIIAQEVEKLFPELVRTDQNGYKAVAYDKLSVLLLQGMKEQQTEIERAKTENREIRSELDKLREELDLIKSVIGKPVAGSR